MRNLDKQKLCSRYVYIYVIRGSHVGRCRVLLLLASRAAVSVPLRTTWKPQEGKWHDRIVADKLTGGIRYLCPHERIVAKRKKRKFIKSWLTKKEPTTMMRNWMKIM